MKRRILFSTFLVAALAVYFSGLRVAKAAGGITISFQILTTGQDTYVQTTIIPQMNTALCAKFGLGPSCTAGQLTTAGCVAQTADLVTKRNLVYQNCTPFTLNAAGESLLAADLFAKDLIAIVSNDKAASITSACTNFKALSAGNQNTICAALGAPVPATVCDICN